MVEYYSVDDFDDFLYAIDDIAETLNTLMLNSRIKETEAADAVGPVEAHVIEAVTSLFEASRLCLDELDKLNKDGADSDSQE